MLDFDWAWPLRLAVQSFDANLSGNWHTADIFFPIGPLLRDELTVPGKQGIRSNKRFEFIKQPATKDFGFHGQSYPLFVGEPKPLPFELILENTVLFYKIVDDPLLVAVKPAGQGNYEEVEGLYDRGHCANRLSVILPDNNIIRFVRIFAPYGLCFIEQENEANKENPATA
ncbi:MAG: hypothetical protein ABFS22_01705 [Pseudomonadota bacterium]